MGWPGECAVCHKGWWNVDSDPPPRGGPHATQKGKTALIYAAESKAAVVTKLLIEAGADVNCEGDVSSPITQLRGKMQRSH